MILGLLAKMTVCNECDTKTKKSRVACCIKGSDYFRKGLQIRINQTYKAIVYKRLEGNDAKEKR